MINTILSEKISGREGVKSAIQALQNVPLSQQELLEDAANEVRIRSRSLHVALVSLIAQLGSEVWRVRAALGAACDTFREACAAIMACGLREERYLTHIEGYLHDFRERLADEGIFPEEL